MKTYTLRVTPDENGNLVLEIPADSATKAHEVVIVVHPLDDNQTHESEIPPAGTGARMAFEAEKANITSEQPIDASKTDDILNRDFADYLFN